MGSLSLLQGIFLTQESNWGLLHCRRILYQLSYQRSPSVTLSKVLFPGQTSQSPGGSLIKPNPFDYGWMSNLSSWGSYVCMYIPIVYTYIVQIQAYRPFRSWVMFFELKDMVQKKGGKEVEAEMKVSLCTLFEPSRLAQATPVYTFPFDNGICCPCSIYKS